MLIIVVLPNLQNGYWPNTCFRTFRRDRPRIPNKPDQSKLTKPEVGYLPWHLT